MKKDELEGLGLINAARSMLLMLSRSGKERTLDIGSDMSILCPQLACAQDRSGFFPVPV